jgi:quercetin dioxygenase-like cupin family protein
LAVARKNPPFLCAVQVAGLSLTFSFATPFAFASTPKVESNTKLPPGTHCYDIGNLRLAVEEFSKHRPCLRKTCSSIKSEDQCNSDDARKQGCSWCGGSCKPIKAVHQAFIACVRKAYEGHQPDRVNGKLIPGIVSMSTQKYSYTGSTGAVTLSPQVPDDLRRKDRWDISEVSRPKGERVPIHMHPSPGVIKILEGEDIRVFVEGEKDLVGLKTGDYYSMPANRKMGTHCAGPTGYKDMDIFKINPCYPTWVVLEPSGYFIQDQQFAVDKKEDCN